MAAPRVKPKVLLVDDRADNLVAMQAVLVPLDCDVATASSGEEALKALLNDDYAVILLDVQMPGLDGFETARLIKARERTREIPIIFVTAISTEPPHIHQGYAAGAVDYLFKPYDPEVLRAKVGVFLALHETTRALSESEGLWRSIFENAPIGMARIDSRGRIVHANRALGALLGRSAEELRGRGLDTFVAEDVRGDDAERREALVAGALGGYSTELDLTDMGDERIPCVCSFSAVPREGAGDLGLIVQVHDMRDRRRAEAERAAHVRAKAKRAQAEQLTQRLAAVQRITDAALGSLAFDELISELLVRTSDVLGVDRAAILLHAEDGSAAVHQMAEGVPGAIGARTWKLPDSGFAAEVLDAGGPVTSDGRTRGHPLGDAVASLLGVPLLVDGRAIGALHVGSLFPRRFSLDDATILSLAAERAALAIQRMRLFEREHLIARDLQRSLLPEALPVLPGLQTAARYLPGGAGTEVGGDWYDAVALPTGKLLLVVGDVAGRGIGAASTMGQLRSAVRSYALLESDPAALLDRLNRFQFSMAWDDMATVLLAVIDPSAATLAYATAGHPPPLVVGPADPAPSAACAPAAYLVGGRGAPLGALERAPYTTATAQLEPGSTLFLYTDGLIEQRGEHPDEGLARLRAAALAGPVELGALCDHVVDTVLPSYDTDDDVTLLILRTLSDRAERLELEVLGDEPSLRAFRGTLRRWLAAADAAPEELHDITMAANEAIQNAIEHGHALTRRAVDVALDRSDGTIEVVVRDHGAWRAPRDSERGRGLPLMRALMDTVSVDPGAHGTTVTLRRALASQSGLTNGTNLTGSSSSRTMPDDSERERTSRSSPSPATGATSRPPAAS
jgi:PAS domain S-box-containing protein